MVKLSARAVTTVVISSLVGRIVLTDVAVEGNEVTKKTKMTKMTKMTKISQYLKSRMILKLKVVIMVPVSAPLAQHECSQLFAHGLAAGLDDGNVVILLQ